MTHSAALERAALSTRRQFLQLGALGLGGLALAELMGDSASASGGVNPLAPKQRRRVSRPCSTERT